jgi:hypothetical protein
VAVSKNNKYKWLRGGGDPTFLIFSEVFVMKEQNQVEKQQKKQGRKRQSEPKHAKKSNEQ